MSRPITIAAGKFPDHRQARDIKTPSVKQARAAALRKADKREYPKHHDGQSTAHYVERYQLLNAGLNLTPDDDFFQPLSTNPQFAQRDEVIEEICE